VSAAAVAVCVAAVAFQGGSTGTGSVLLEEDCVIDGPADDVAGLVGGSVAVVSEPGTVTRLGVTRIQRAADQGVRVVWDRSGPVATQEDGVVVRTVFTRADGSGARVVEHVMGADGTMTGPGTPLTDGPTGVLLPLETVDGLGDGWTWTLSTVVDGRESPRCVARTV
jgi:Mce-associated membrane protein